MTLKRAVLQRSGTPGTPSLQLGLFKAIYEHHFKNTFSKVKVQLTRWSQQQKNYNFYGNIFVVILIIPITMQNLCHGTRHHCARNTKQKDSLWIRKCLTFNGNIGFGFFPRYWSDKRLLFSVRIKDVWENTNIIISYLMVYSNLKQQYWQL